MAPRRRNQSVKALRQQLSQLNAKISGRRLAPSRYPPVVDSHPWAHWTFDRSNEISDPEEVSLTISTSDIATQLRFQNGWSGNKLEIKVENCKFWLTARALAMPDLKSEFYDLGDQPVATPALRETLRDKGTLNVPARVGYSYPESDSLEIAAGSEDIVVAKGTAQDSQGCVLTTQMSIWYRSSPATGYRKPAELEANYLHHPVKHN